MKIYGLDFELVGETEGTAVYVFEADHPDGRGNLSVTIAVARDGYCTVRLWDYCKIIDGSHARKSSMDYAVWWAIAKIADNLRARGFGHIVDQVEGGWECQSQPKSQS